MLCGDEYAAGAAVEAVDGAEDEALLRKVRGHEVGEGAVHAAGLGQRGHGRGLIDDEQLLVLKEYGQRPLLRLDALVVGVAADGGERLTRGDGRIGIDGAAVEEEALLRLDEADLPGGHAKDGAQHLVHAPSRIFLCDAHGKAALLHHASSTLEYLAIMSTISCEGSISSSCFLPSRMKNR